MERISFQAKARTVDHLGREQIADCPTAISELWKNAYDAYARNVELNLYPNGDKASVAALFDDGHGMSYDEFVGKWLVVGSESKATDSKIDPEDQNGLKLRPKLGQKGIGRLSSANLGPLLLIISKRRDNPFVVSLLDWRLFENPYLNLSDIEIPVTTVGSSSEIEAAIDGLRLALATNIPVRTDDEPTDREKRIAFAWKQFDQLNQERGEPLVSVEIAELINNFPISTDHLKEWSVWQQNSSHGTAMIIGELNFDLEAQLNRSWTDPAAAAARARLFETLSSFVDPYFEGTRSSFLTSEPDFSYAVKAWDTLVPRVIVGKDKEFSSNLIQDVEHVIDGIIDENGVFHGRVKAFGVWRDENVRIAPGRDVVVPNRNDAKVGPFGLYIGALEFEQKNTTHTPAELRYFKELADLYSGFLVFRDGLRVLPYGRADNDFFEIEYRRSKHAGREFWNHRQMFGRVALSKRQNPNLKDKAGREGFIDNRAAKTLKELVANVLMQSARKYFGSNSEIRKEILPELNADHKKKKAAEAREKLRLKASRTFSKQLKDKSPLLPGLLEDVKDFSRSISVNDESDIQRVQENLEQLRLQLASFTLPPKPNKINKSIATRYSDYRATLRSTKELLDTSQSEFEQQVEKIAPKAPIELLEEQIQRGNRSYQSLIRTLRDSVTGLLKSQNEFALELEKRNKQRFLDDATLIMERMKRDEISYQDASKLLYQISDSTQQLAHDEFGPYTRALEILAENIDLAQLAEFDLNEANELSAEVDRLTSLAQLGIAVEISGHELQDYQDLISSSFSKIPPECRDNQALADIRLGFEGLVDQLRFLSPLRLAGQKIRENITGDDIHAYLLEFFRLRLAQQKVELRATEAFRQFSITEFRSRLYPVFVNLVNNSIYWTSNQSDERLIILDVIDNEIIVSDNGPGIDEEDQSQLFTLFFTKKAHGGRGVGLYLCRANLASGGHKIRYVYPPKDMPLNGANFAIKLLGADYG